METKDGKTVSGIDWEALDKEWEEQYREDYGHLFNDQ